MGLWLYVAWHQLLEMRPDSPPKIHTCLEKLLISYLLHQYNQTLRFPCYYIRNQKHLVSVWKTYQQVWCITFQPKRQIFVCDVKLPKESWNILQHHHRELEGFLQWNLQSKEEICTHKTILCSLAVLLLTFLSIRCPAHMLCSSKHFPGLSMILICALCKYVYSGRFWIIKHTELHLETEFYKIFFQ